MYGVKWAFFDLDGTIIPDGYSISNRTLMAIMYLKSKGIKIGIATGRTYFFAEALARKINIDLPLICINGAWILGKDNFGTLKEDFISFNAQNEILRILNEKNIDYLVYSSDGVYSTSEHHPFFQRLGLMRQHLKCSIPYNFEVVKNKKIFRDMKIFKILINYENNEDKIQLLTLFKDIPNVSFASSQKNVIDIFSSESDKANAIKWLLEKRNIKSHEIIVFGDNENDINMFQLTSKSVALKNASEKVKRYAKFKTDYECEEEGVADFIFRHF